MTKKFVGKWGRKMRKKIGKSSKNAKKMIEKIFE